MLKRWAAWPPGIRRLVGIAAVVLAAAIVWALFVPLADWLARHDVGPAGPALLQTARDAARGRLLTLAAGLFAAGALVFTALNFNLSREGQVTDRYTKAIEQLGSGKLDVRIGGIYALERIARDSTKDHPTVMEVLAAFIREHSREQWPPSDAGSPGQERLTPPDVRAAVTVVSRRDAKRDISPIDFTGANLADARLTGANLAGVNLGGANLAGANLADAVLTSVNLSGANLAGAHLTGANLAGASLGSADLTRADLGGSVLTRANLWSADLTGAVLTGAVLTGAVLTGAVLTGADLAGANLTRTYLAGAKLAGARLTGPFYGGANLTGANLTDATLTGAWWPTAEPVPEGWMIDGESGRLKAAGRLSEVMTHYL